MFRLFRNRHRNAHSLQLSTRRLPAISRAMGEKKKVTAARNRDRMPGLVRQLLKQVECLRIGVVATTNLDACGIQLHRRGSVGIGCMHGGEGGPHEGECVIQLLAIAVGTNDSEKDAEWKRKSDCTWCQWIWSWSEGA